MPLAVVALGVSMIFTRPLDRTNGARIAAAMVFVTVTVNVVVVPAIANTLSLRDFTDHAIKIVGAARSAIWARSTTTSRFTAAAQFRSSRKEIRTYPST